MSAEHLCIHVTYTCGVYIHRRMWSLSFVSIFKFEISLSAESSASSILVLHSCLVEDSLVCCSTGSRLHCGSMCSYLCSDDVYTGVKVLSIVSFIRDCDKC